MELDRNSEGFLYIRRQLEGFFLHERPFSTLCRGCLCTLREWRLMLRLGMIALRRCRARRYIGRCLKQRYLALLEGEKHKFHVFPEGFHVSGGLKSTFFLFLHLHG